MKATYVILEDLFRHDQINRLHDRKNVSGQIHAIGIFKMVSSANTEFVKTVPWERVGDITTCNYDFILNIYVNDNQF